MDLNALKRFEDSEDSFKLTKVKSKRESRVNVGQSATGDFYLVDIPEDASGPAGTAVAIAGNGYNYLRTSPVVKIMDFTETSTLFETEGGFYRLEKV